MGPRPDSTLTHAISMPSHSRTSSSCQTNQWITETATCSHHGAISVATRAPSVTRHGDRRLSVIGHETGLRASLVQQWTLNKHMHACANVLILYCPFCLSSPFHPTYNNNNYTHDTDLW